MATGVKKNKKLDLIKPSDNQNIDKSENPKLSRVYALDTLRGYCVLYMIAWHYYFFLKVGFLETDFFIFWIMNVIGLVGNPIFIIVMGAALVLSIDRRKQKGNNFRSNFIHLIKRALVFFAIHHIMVISYVLYFGTLAFQMPGLYPGWIPSLGINAIFCFFLMKFRKLYRVLIMIGLKIQFYIRIPYFGIDFGSLFYMLFGTIIGELIIEARKNDNLLAFQKKLFIIGIILFIIGVPSEIYISEIYDLTVPNINVLDAPFFSIYAIGVFTLLFSILFRIQDNTTKKRSSKPLTIFSSLSLTLYYLHYVIGTNFFMPFGFGNLLSLYSYLLFLICFYILIYLIGVVWSRSKNKYSLEWLVRRFS